jgi:chemotaxis protein MotB
MAQNRKNIEPDEDPGAPEWMVTFSDCMTLLLTFFVLLLSFSSFDSSALDNVQRAFGLGQPDSAAQPGRSKGTLAQAEAIRAIKDIPKGSRIPTPTDKAIGNMSSKRRLTDYQRQKVFSIPSEDLFAGNANVINPKNRALLDYMTVFLKTNPSRVVICEFDPKTPEKSDRTSTQRAWTLMKYFIDSKVEAERFSITGSSMLTRNDNLDKRQVVITLLEESVYE